jgi:Cu/Ag efflux pump CusA
MAFAIIGGLVVGMLLILMFLPTLYGTVFGGEDKVAQNSGQSTQAVKTMPA